MRSGGNENYRDQQSEVHKADIIPFMERNATNAKT